MMIVSCMFRMCRAVMINDDNDASPPLVGKRFRTHESRFEMDSEEYDGRDAGSCGSRDFSVRKESRRSEMDSCDDDSAGSTALTVGIGAGTTAGSELVFGAFATRLNANRGLGAAAFCSAANSVSSALSCCQSLISQPACYGGESILTASHWRWSYVGRSGVASTKLFRNCEI